MSQQNRGFQYKENGMSTMQVSADMIAEKSYILSS